MDWDYYIKSMTGTNTTEENFIKDLQQDTQSMLDEMYITGYEVKIGMDFFKEKATLNNTLEFNCLVDRERVKEKILNSISRKIRYAPDIKIKAGDYITHQFHYANEPLRTYIVIAQADPKRGYCESFMTECCFSFNMRDKQGEIEKIYCYPDDNKIMLRDSSIGGIDNLDVSSTWIVIQDNDLTRELNKNIKRILIDGSPYDVIGVNRLPSVKGIVKLAVKNGTPHPQDDLENGIAYNENEELPPEPPTTQFEIMGDDEMWMDLETTYTIDNQTSYDTIWTCDNSKVKFVSSDKTSCTLLCDYDSEMNYKNIVLTARINVVDYTKTIKVKG